MEKWTEVGVSDREPVFGARCCEGRRRVELRWARSGSLRLLAKLLLLFNRVRQIDHFNRNRANKTAVTIDCSSQRIFRMLFSRGWFYFSTGDSSVILCSLMGVDILLLWIIF